MFFGSSSLVLTLEQSYRNFICLLEEYQMNEWKSCLFFFGIQNRTNELDLSFFNNTFPTKRGKKHKKLLLNMKDFIKKWMIGNKGCFFTHEQRDQLFFYPGKFAFSHFGGISNVRINNLFFLRLVFYFTRQNWVNERQLNFSVKNKNTQNTRK